jgi:DNA mismatch endonuclease, patch repair protein
MAQIRSKDTKPEFAVRSLLHKMGYRFRLHRRDLPGNPDIVMPKYRSVIFVHGCFWHFHKKCRDGKIPATNKKYWSKKLQNNQLRDKTNIKKLREGGWRVLVIWECEVKKRLEKLTTKITKFLIDNLPPKPEKL